MPALAQSLQEIADLLQTRLDELLPEVTTGAEGKLFDAMRYAVLSEGKRLRPFLTVTCAKLFGVGKASAIQTAAAIELVHAYSLVHDDLPAIDNDDFRRGQPSCHKQFDEATAILTGDSLLTMAFEILSHESTHADAKVRCQLISSLAKAAGYQGMVGGQMMDLESANRTLAISEITRLQRLKTGALFAISCEAGAILGKSARNLQLALRGYANALGLAFQITDDLLDAESDEESHSDKFADSSGDKPTFVSSLGMEQARKQAFILAEQAIDHLDAFDERADLLRDLAKFVVERDF